MVHPLSGYSVRPAHPPLGAAGGTKADYIQHPEKHFPVADETLVINSRARVGGAHYLSIPEPQPSGGHKWGLKIPGAKHWSWHVQEGQGAISIPLPILLTSLQSTCLIRPSKCTYPYVPDICSFFSFTVLHYILKRPFGKQTMIFFQLWYFCVHMYLTVTIKRIITHP